MKGGEIIMYNEEIKRRYINENKNRNLNLEKQCIILFNRCQPYEESADKDIACFSTAEILECFQAFNTVSLESLLNARSQYKIYTDWCIANNILVKDRQNHFREINTEMLKGCLNSYFKDKRVITRDYLLSNMDTLLNPGEKFVLLGLFEGIGSNTNIAYKDFENLTIECFDTETHQLRVGNRLIKYSQELYKLAKEAANTYDNVVYDKNGNERHVKLADDDRIVKPASNASTFDYRNIIMKKLQKIKKALNNPVLNIQALKESGRIDMINKLVKEGMTREQAMDNKDVINTYGVMPAKKRYISNYFAE